MKPKKKLKNIKNSGLESEIKSGSITKNSDDYDENYMKINLIQMTNYKVIEIPSMIIIVRAVFHKNNEYYPQVFYLKLYINYK